jgi:hypothetical protein
LPGSLPASRWPNSFFIRRFMVVLIYLIAISEIIGER